MKKSESKKGACSSHTKAATAHCLVHNDEAIGARRPSYCNPDLTHLNRRIYADDSLFVMRNGERTMRRSLQPLIEAARIKYEHMVGQRCQASFVPFRESVFVINEDVSDEQILAACREIEQLTGCQLLGLWGHEDEGHARQIYGTDKWQKNRHAHALWACQDPVTGKARKMGQYYSQMQDILARHTGMSRGNKAAQTGIKHRDHAQYRLDILHDQLDESKAELDTLNIAIASKTKKLNKENGNAILRGVARAIGLPKAKEIKDKEQQIKEIKAQLEQERQLRRELKKEYNAATADKEELKAEIEKLTASIKALNAAKKKLEDGNNEKMKEVSKRGFEAGKAAGRAERDGEVAIATAAKDMLDRSENTAVRKCLKQLQIAKKRETLSDREIEIIGGSITAVAAMLLCPEIVAAYALVAIAYDGLTSAANALLDRLGRFFGGREHVAGVGRTL